MLHAGMLKGLMDGSLGSRTAAMLAPYNDDPKNSGSPRYDQDKLNANLGIYGQDVMTFKRATITLGGRWEYISEQITGQDAQVGRFVNIPAFTDQQQSIDEVKRKLKRVP